MLFNSHEFVFVFLPLACAVFAYLVRGSWVRSIWWLTGISLAFYAWWNPANLVVLLGSLIANLFIGGRITSHAADPARRAWLTLGVVLNLTALIHFKYAAFAVANWNGLTGMNVPLPGQELPLGISFFTFQQIAYLIDIYRRKMAAHSVGEYALFVSFFPQLIAGPIVRPDDILPQFRRSRSERIPRSLDYALGLTQFAIGLFKKTVLADGIAVLASRVFDQADMGIGLSPWEAWGGTLAYTFQLYFDFSGYSDMAIGAARLFGIRLPVNFDSPYQAGSIGDFWRRWHMTLSSFLREFIYFPLGGSRCTEFRRNLNLLLTMLLGGLWHGAGWTYVAWGGLHGVYLMIDHAWRRWRQSTETATPGIWPRLLTFLCVVVAWVLFRATSLESALHVYAGMVGWHGTRVNETHLFHSLGDWLWLGSLAAIAWWTPNSQQWVRMLEEKLTTPNLATRPQWGSVPTALWGGAVGFMGAVAILRMSAISEFVYFQF